MSGFSMTSGLVLASGPVIDGAGREVRVWRSPDGILTVTTKLTDFDPPGPEGDGGSTSFESAHPILGAPGRLIEVDDIPPGDVTLDRRPGFRSITMKTNSSWVERQTPRARPAQCGRRRHRRARDREQRQGHVGPIDDGRQGRGD